MLDSTSLIIRVLALGTFVWGPCVASALANVVWSTAVPSPTPGDNEGFLITTDSAGNSYVVGSDGDRGTVAEDIFVAKVDADGVVQWQDTIQDTVGTFDRPVGIGLDGSGALYVGGSVGGDWSLTRYDTNGNILWTRTVGDPLLGQEDAFNMHVEADGHVTMVGRVGSFVSTMARFDSQGNQLWSVSLPATAGNVLVASDGSIYLAGVKSVDFQADLWVAKYTAAGSMLWEYGYDAGAGGPIPDDRASGILEDGDGNLVVTGFSWRDIGGTITRDDFTTLKLDPMGQELWVRHHVASNFNDQIRGAGVDPVSGNIYVMGYYSGSSLNTKIVAYDTDGNELWSAFPNGHAYLSSRWGRSLVVGDDGSVYVGVARQSATQRTIVLFRYAPDGSLVSELEYDTPGLDYNSDMELAATGDLYMVGSENSATDSESLDMVVLRVALPSAPTAVPDGSAPPASVRFLSSYPNPFNPQTVLRFVMEREAWVRLQVFDARGRSVVTLVDGPVSEGDHRVPWNGRDGSGQLMPSGAYFARLTTPGAVTSRALRLVK